MKRSDGYLWIFHISNIGCTNNVQRTKHKDREETAVDGWKKRCIGILIKKYTKKITKHD